MTERCAGKSYHDYAGGGWLGCARKGKHEEDGKLWCFQHQPSKVKARRDESSRLWQQEWDARRRKRAIEDKIRNAREGLVEACLQLDPAPSELKHLIENVRKAEEAK